jgi:uncharacterized RDD family membrane protein YckC
LSTSNPYAPPRGHVRDVEPEALEPADRVQRLGAFLVDGVAGFLMIYFPALTLLLATGALDDTAEIDGTTIATALFLCLIGLIAWALITALLVARNGQTIGKRLLEIKVVRSDGSVASLGRIFWLRNFVNWLLGVIPLYVLVDLLFIFSERRQCIHDLLADTIVVRA